MRRHATTTGLATGRKNERGVTMVELLVAITLVAALSTGMLMAIRSSLITMNKINTRLESNRRVLGLQQIVSRQIGGVIPLAKGCGLQGGPESLSVVTTYSLNEGSRGFPHAVVFSVVPDPQGGVRLIENESLWSGSCGGGSGADPDKALVLAGGLRAATFAYHEPQRPNTPSLGGWMSAWGEPVLPSAVRIETEPLKAIASNLPALSVNVALHITKLPTVEYLDEK